MFLLTFLLLGIMTTAVMAADLEISGELSQGLIYNFDEEQLSAADTNYKLELAKELGFDGKLYLSFKGNYDLLNQTGDINLDEAYTSIYLDTTDLTIGRQVINWGTADGINPTNSINPKSMDSFTNGELNGEPVLSAQATYYGNNFNLTGVVIPDFVPQDISSFSSMGGGEEYSDLFANLDLTNDEPENKLENMEYALKAETRAAGYDLKFSYFHGWEDVPALKMRLNSEGNPVINPETGQPVLFAQYRKVDKLGLATAGTLNNVGVWAEAAYVIPEKLKVDSAAGEVSMSMNEPYLQAVIGSDYTFDNGIYAEGQYLYYGNGSLIIPYNLNPGEEVEAGQYLMSRFSYDFDQDNTVELTSIINLDDQSGLVIPAYTHRLTQVTDLKVSPILTIGEDGELSNLPQQLNVSIKTSF
ncbi:MAG: hypothetical protein PWR10_1847 [Halanaerobiales bacterium]|nr:hypothetical protein [Halanaerobiales bacterium]